MIAEYTAAQRAVLDVHQARLKALVDGDLEALERLVGEDMVYISAHGAVQTRAQVFESIRSARLRIHRLDSDDVTVTLYGDVAITRYRAESHSDDGDDVIQGTVRSTAVYVMRDGRWQLVSAHNCLIRQS